MNVLRCNCILITLRSRGVRDLHRRPDRHHHVTNEKTCLHLPSPLRELLGRLWCYEPGWLEGCALSSTSVEPRVPTMYIVLPRAVSLVAKSVRTQA
jgi:hypothetical protein